MTTLDNEENGGLFFNSERIIKKNIYDDMQYDNGKEWEGRFRDDKVYDVHKHGLKKGERITHKFNSAHSS